MLQIFQVQPTEKKESKTLRGGEGPTPLNTAWNSVDRENTTSPLALSTYTYKNDNNTVFFCDVTVLNIVRCQIMS